MLTRRFAHLSSWGTEWWLCFEELTVSTDQVQPNGENFAEVEREFKAISEERVEQYFHELCTRNPTITKPEFDRRIAASRKLLDMELSPTFLCTRSRRKSGLLLVDGHHRFFLRGQRVRECRVFTTNGKRVHVRDGIPAHWGVKGGLA